MVKSPCDNECYTENGQCGHCGRTLSEITNWTKLSDEQKQKILVEIRKNRDADKWR